MIRVASQRTLRPFLAAAIVLAGGAVGALAISYLAGTKTGFILALASVGGPAVLYLAIVAPIVLPFGLYVALVPFDNLLTVSAFGTLTKALGIASGFALIFYLLRTKRAVAPDKSLLLWAALYVWAATTAFWALDPSLLLAPLGTSMALLLLYAATCVFPVDRNAVRWICFVVIASGVCAAAYGAYLFHNGVDIYYGGRLRITTETGSIDPNHFAAALLLPIALSISALLHARKLWVAVGAIMAAGMCFLGVGLSASRGAFLAIAVMLVYFLIRTRAKGRMIAFLAASTCAAIPYVLQSFLWNRLSETLASGGAGRTAIWRVGLEALKSSWLFGAGYGNFVLAYDRAFIHTTTQLWSESKWHSASHNLLVGTWVELGIVGLVLLLAAWASQFAVLRDIGPSEPEYPTRIALEASVLGIFVAALFLDVMTFKYIWLVFMLIALQRNAFYLRKRRDTYA